MHCSVYDNFEEKYLKGFYCSLRQKPSPLNTPGVMISSIRDHIQQLEISKDYKLQTVFRISTFVSFKAKMRGIVLISVTVLVVAVLCLHSAESKNDERHCDREMKETCKKSGKVCVPGRKGQDESAQVQGNVVCLRPVIRYKFK